jgi:hypothetical protein
VQYDARGVDDASQRGDGEALQPLPDALQENIDRRNRISRERTGAGRFDNVPHLAHSEGVRNPNGRGSEPVDQFLNGGKPPQGLGSGHKEMLH